MKQVVEVVGAVCCGWVTLGLVLAAVGIARAPRRDDWD